MNDELIEQLREKALTAKACRAENISVPAARFLAWLFTSGGNQPNAEVSQYGFGLAYSMLKVGYATNPLGDHGIAHTNLWNVTPEGMDLLKRLVTRDV